jgi:hypothetical protein
MKFVLLILFSVICCITTYAQYMPETIQSSFTLQSERLKLKKTLYERTIQQSFSVSPDSTNEYRYQSAFWAISQFMVSDSSVMRGFKKTFAVYPSLEKETRRSFLEALYTINPKQFQREVQQILLTEQEPKLFSMAALFLFRNNIGYKFRILENIDRRFPEQKENTILLALVNYLSHNNDQVQKPLPEIQILFASQQKKGIKTIYSFQRWNRDYTGLAIIQEADGKFARDSAGRLIAVRQLARSGSNLPYFITNGNTPQGIFSIQGIESSHNNFIGPTPNLQMLMPFEGNWQNYFQNQADSLNNQLTYTQLLPAAWQSYFPMQEAFIAGKAGRTEIIAHGTTIDPEYFYGKPFYPISPTLGCLCAEELWNANTGKLALSEQLKLVNTFLRTSGNKGFLMVINLDNQQQSVSEKELEKIVAVFEKNYKAKLPVSQTD